MTMSNDSKIYVVDDDPRVLESVRLLLCTHGYDAQCFESAEQFLDGVDLDCVGCVISDLRMPGISGRELQTRLLLADSRDPRVTGIDPEAVIHRINAF